MEKVYSIWLVEEALKRVEKVLLFIFDMAVV